MPSKGQTVSVVEETERLSGSLVQHRKQQFSGLPMLVVTKHLRFDLKPNPKIDSKSNGGSYKLRDTVSFQHFQASISDVWTINDTGDAFHKLSGVNDDYIWKKISKSAALNVLHNHKTKCDQNINKQGLMEYIDSNNVPGCPQKNRARCHDKDCEAKLERFEKLLSSTSTISQLRKLSWSGIPVKIRATTWKLLSRYLPLNREKQQRVLEMKRRNYWNLVIQWYDTEAHPDTYHQIHIDVLRMNSAVPLFQQSTVQKIFERILFIWAIRHPNLGYVQGMNDLVTPFFVVFLQDIISNDESFELLSIDTLSEEERDAIEADSFWCLSKFLDGVQDNYTFGQLGIQQKIHQIQELIRRVDGTLHRHLNEHNVEYLQFSFRWLNNLLTRELPLRCTIRLWDTYLAESDSLALFQLYVCAAFLLQWRKILLDQSDFQGIMLLLQNLPTQNWTGSDVRLLVAEAYYLKVVFADAPNHLVNNLDLT
ncbi:hypothetical protein FQA39_LY10603 [Lamprigera yunnana]|nr:hypothetical protein FQA39_LY10603 [Lamprigera yunnana]